MMEAYGLLSNHFLGAVHNESLRGLASVTVITLGLSLVLAWSKPLNIPGSSSQHRFAEFLPPADMIKV
jgi:hypothetical protein